MKMAIFITNGSVEIGTAKIRPERKKPCLCIRRGNALKVYGYFTSEELAMEFVDELMNFINAKNPETE